MTARLAALAVAVVCLAAPALAQTTGTAPSDGVDLYYHTYGEGPPLLVLNGGPGLSSEHFAGLARQLAALGDGHRVILFDQRGTGRSPLATVSSSTITVDLMVRDIEALRRHLGTEAWAVLGHSWGGMYAMLYATRHPDRVRGLVLSSSGGADLSWLDYVGSNIRMRLGPERRAVYERSFDPAYQALDPDRAARERVESLAAAYVYDPENIPFVVESLTREGANFPQVRGLVYADLRRTGYDLYDALAGFTRPALVVHGRQDLLGDLVPFRTNEALANSEIVWLDQCSHYGWLDQPDAYFGAIGAFLARLT
ncbi:alpha/beta fold hydrolase [Rubrivirga sp. IMCC43871]|uniref:alpha/beta fold hydrolase n=1 Tax=Rubrivirga sp. IMCC43871 TaxID=3391575 RepID=UPI0039900240